MKLTDSGGRKKVAFTREEMKIIIDTLDTSHSRKEIADHHYWGGILGAYTGARLNELASLNVRDVVEVDGHWCIDIVDDGGNKKIKNESSERRIPLHSEILSRGFLNYVQALQSERLFPKLSFHHRDGYGRAVGRWFNDKFLVQLGIKNKQKSYHCFRHAFATYLVRKDVPHDKVQALFGHKQQSVLHTHYAEGFELSQLKNEIEKLSY